MRRQSSLSPGVWITRNRWIWSAIGVLILWIVLSLVTSHFSFASLSGVAVSASFLLLVSLGQTLVITTGRGNIDLSIPSVLTLSAYLSLIFIHGDNAMIIPGLLAILGIGFVIGAVNAVLVIYLRIPAIIVTLATGYILATGYVIANEHIPGFQIAPALQIVAADDLWTVPIIVIIAILGTVATAYVLNKTAYGQSLSAVGQNLRAARLAGVRTGRVTGIAFVTSSMLAALTGVLFGAYVGGAFLQMGQPYLLRSIGAVVLGGTLIYGGGPSALGTLFGSLLLVLIVTTMQIAGLPTGTQGIVQGLVIIGVLVLAGGIAFRRRTKQSPSDTSGGQNGKHQDKGKAST